MWLHAIEANASGRLGAFDISESIAQLQLNEVIKHLDVKIARPP